MTSVNGHTVRVFTYEELAHVDDDATLRQKLEYLRSRGSAMDDYNRLMAMLPKMADELVALEPGLTWKWGDKLPHSGCIVNNHSLSSEYNTPLILIDSTWEGKWGKVLGIVGKYAKEFGAIMPGGLGIPDGKLVNFISPNGTNIEIRYIKATVISASTGCRLRQDIYDGQTSIDDAIAGKGPEHYPEPK